MQEAWVPSLGWEEPLEKGNGNPVQYPCLEDHVDRGAWWAAVHGVTESQTSLTAPTSLLIDASVGCLQLVL